MNRDVMKSFYDEVIYLPKYKYFKARGLTGKIVFSLLDKLPQDIFFMPGVVFSFIAII